MEIMYTGTSSIRAFLCKSYLYKAIEKDEMKDEVKDRYCKRTKIQ